MLVTVAIVVVADVLQRDVIAEEREVEPALARDTAGALNIPAW
jgi:hypothetical protein